MSSPLAARPKHHTKVRIEYLEHIPGQGDFTVQVQQVVSELGYACVRREEGAAFSGQNSEWSASNIFGPLKSPESREIHDALTTRWPGLFDHVSEDDFLGRGGVDICIWLCRAQPRRPPADPAEVRGVLVTYDGRDYVVLSGDSSAPELLFRNHYGGWEKVGATGSSTMEMVAKEILTSVGRAVPLRDPDRSNKDALDDLAMNTVQTRFDLRRRWRTKK